MNTAWLMLFVAGLLEVGWAIGLKLSDGFNFRGRPLASTLTVAAMVASFYLLAAAVRTIPIGTAYAIWTGIGAVGAATIGMIFFKNEPATPARIACVILVVAGIIGLKLTSGAHAAAPRHEPGATTMPTAPIAFYIGGYAGAANKGVYRSTLDLATGAMTAPTLAIETRNPSFLAQHPTLDVLYAVSEVNGADGKPAGGVKAFRIAGDGTLTETSARSSRGNGPCHVAVDPAGRLAFAANYGDGTVAAFPVDDDGAIGDAVFARTHAGSGPVAKRQAGPHAHCLVPDPSGRFALAADLGADSVFVYRIENGTLVAHGEARLPPGAGPRHLAFAVDGRFAYVANELDSTVATFAWDSAAGALTFVDVRPTLPPEHAKPNAPSEIAVHPGGRFLYVANRGHDSLAVFRVDPATGRLAAAGHAGVAGHWPRHFAIEPGGRFLIVANERSDALVAFRIDPDTGALTPSGSTVSVGAPACVRFVR